MSNPILTALDERRTTNLFDPAFTLDDEQIAEMVRLATKAPTAFNLQNWRFIAVRTPDAKARLRSAAWDQAKVTDAAVTFIVCGTLADASVLADRLAPMVDAGIMPADMVPAWKGGADGLYAGQAWRQRDEAVRSATFGSSALMFAAQGMGLGSAPMIGFDAEAVSREFGLGADEVPVVLVAVGSATAENWPQKPRRAVSEILDLI